MRGIRVGMRAADIAFDATLFFAYAAIYCHGTLPCASYFAIFMADIFAAVITAFFFDFFAVSFALFTRAFSRCERVISTPPIIAD